MLHSKTISRDRNKLKKNISNAESKFHSDNATIIKYLIMNRITDFCYSQ